LGSTTSHTEETEGVESDSEPTLMEAQIQLNKSGSKLQLKNPCMFVFHGYGLSESNFIASAIPSRGCLVHRQITDHAAEALKRKHRQKLLELVKAKFPDGNVPVGPYMEAGAGLASIGTPRTIKTKYTNDPAEVAQCERRRKLLELAYAAFPDGNVRMPYLLVPMAGMETMPMAS
jgi:hypothetical protein